MVGLQENVKGVWQPVERAAQAEDSAALQQRLQREYLRLYNQAGQRFTAHLGSEADFSLRAAWKQREIARYSATMATNLQKTMAARRESLDKWALAEIAKGRAAGEVRAEASATWRKWLQYKQGQMEGILNARAQLEAQTDILVHSGFVNPELDRVMYFGGSPMPCATCIMIAAGNPYTIAEARFMGGVAHPNCRDRWEELAPPGINVTNPLGQISAQWKVAADRLNVARQQVRDGSVKLWTGQPRTTAAGRAVPKERALRQTEQPWKKIGPYAEKVQARRAA